MECGTAFETVRFSVVCRGPVGDSDLADLRWGPQARSFEVVTVYLVVGDGGVGRGERCDAVTQAQGEYGFASSARTTWWADAARDDCPVGFEIRRTDHLGPEVHHTPNMHKLWQERKGGNSIGTRNILKAKAIRALPDIRYATGTELARVTLHYNDCQCDWRRVRPPSEAPAGWRCYAWRADSCASCTRELSPSFAKI
jgi:hypothetical protein